MGCAPTMYGFSMMASRQSGSPIGGVGNSQTTHSSIMAECADMILEHDGGPANNCGAHELNQLGTGWVKHVKQVVRAVHVLTQAYAGWGRSIFQHVQLTHLINIALPLQGQQEGHNCYCSKWAGQEAGPCPRVHRPNEAQHSSPGPCPSSNILALYSKE